MDSIYLRGLDRWRDREINKVFHYRDMLKQDNIKDSEKKVIEKRVEDLNVLISNINQAYNKEDERKPRVKGEGE